MRCDNCYTLGAPGDLWVATVKPLEEPRALESGQLAFPSVTLCLACAKDATGVLAEMGARVKDLPQK